MLMAFSVFGQSDSYQAIKSDIGANPINYTHFMALADPSQAQLDSLINMGNEYLDISKDTCIAIADRAMSLVDPLKHPVIYPDALFFKGCATLRLQNDSLGHEILLQARAEYEKRGNKMSMGMVDNYLGTFYMERQELKKSIDFLISSIKIYKEERDSQRLLGPLISIAGVYFYMNVLDKTQSYMEEASALAKATGNKPKLSNILGNQAMIYSSIAKDYKKTFEKDSTKIIFKDSIQFFQNKALESAYQSKDLAEELNNPVSVLTSLTIITGLKNDKGAFKDAARLGKEAIRVADKIGIPVFIIRNNYNLANALFGMGKYTEAIPPAKKSLDLATNMRMQADQAQANTMLYRLYKKTNQFEKAIEQVEEIQKFEKEQNKVNTKKEIAEVETKYQTVEKEKEILSQKNNILELESTNAKIQKQKSFLMGGSILLGFLGFFGYRFNNIRKERNDKIEFAEALIFAQEEERKRIARDLHDGIGQSLLLIKKQMDNTHNTTLKNQALISETLEEVRSISRDLHPIHLEKFGLTMSIENIVEKVSNATEIFVSKDLENIDKLLNDKSNIHVFRTIQEAFNNIVKHADASAANITITTEASKVKILIQDNGKGFDHELTVVKNKSLGLRTMNERITAIGGKFQIKKGTSQGTIIEITIPKI